MGRKHKIKKDNIVLIPKDKNDTIDFSDVKEEIDNSVQISAIFDLKNDLINYCSEQCIPLCDFLTPNMLSEFIEIIKYNK